MIGWIAATGDVTLMPVLLFAIIFFWTPPHFWALALFVETDYAAAGIPMMPVVAGHKSTRRQILVYAVLMLPIAMAPFWLGVAGWLYGAAALLLTAVFLLLALRVAVFRGEAGDMDMRPEKRLFAYSVLYLFVLFGALVADRFLVG
jgi:protoheme IX farnesyltransferase